MYRVLQQIKIPIEQKVVFELSSSGLLLLRPTASLAAAPVRKAKIDLLASI